MHDGKQQPCRTLGSTTQCICCTQSRSAAHYTPCNLRHIPQGAPNDVCASMSLSPGKHGEKARISSPEMYSTVRKQGSRAPRCTAKQTQHALISFPSASESRHDCCTEKSGIMLWRQCVRGRFARRAPPGHGDARAGDRAVSDMPARATNTRAGTACTDTFRAQSESR